MRSSIYILIIFILLGCVPDKNVKTNESNNKSIDTAKSDIQLEVQRHYFISLYRLFGVTSFININNYEDNITSVGRAVNSYLFAYKRFRPTGKNEHDESNLKYDIDHMDKIASKLEVTSNKIDLNSQHIIEAKKLVVKIMEVSIPLLKDSASLSEYLTVKKHHGYLIHYMSILALLPTRIHNNASDILDFNYSHNPNWIEARFSRVDRDITRLASSLEEFKKLNTIKEKEFKEKYEKLQNLVNIIVNYNSKLKAKRILVLEALASLDIIVMSCDEIISSYDK